MEFSKLLRKIENREFYPIYFLEGEEDFFIDKVTALIEKSVLTEDEKAFNQTILYGRESTLDSVLTAAQRYPIMSDYQVVIVKEAQELKDIEKLVSYCNDPLESTLLVFTYRKKSLDKKKPLAKAIAKNGVFLESKRLYDNQVPGWIADFITQKGYKIEQKAAMLLSENIGNNLKRISNELDKVFLLLNEGEKVTLDLIEENIGISKEFNTFELQDALATKDVLKANKIVNHMATNPKQYPLPVTIATLFNFTKKLLIYHYEYQKLKKDELAKIMGVHPYFIDTYQKASRNYNIRKCVENIGLLRKYDTMSKGVNNGSSTDEALLKEMVFMMMH